MTKVLGMGSNWTERNDDLELALANYRATHPDTYLKTFFMICF